MLSEFKRHIDTNLAFLKESRILVAISGGLDSVVLTQLCHALKLDCSLAHCNFNLRADESDADEAFVLQLANQYHMEVFSQSFNTMAYAEQEQLSIQMAARELRYHWFEQLRNDLNFDYILTAHHADDSIETFLINLSRGTGLEGLTGIPEVNGRLVRPLLQFSREHLQQYANKLKLKWREDSSNGSTKYLRNALRLEVIPKLKELNPKFLDNALNTMQHLKQASFLLDEHIAIVRAEAIDFTRNKESFYNCNYLLNKDNTKDYLYHLFNYYNFTEWEDVLRLLTAQSGKFLRSKTHQLLKNRDHLILSELEPQPKSSLKLTSLNETAQLPFGELTVHQVEKKEDNSQTAIYVDGDQLQFPLVLRKWKEGDVFYPFGMSGKKKLSKYFKDEKFSLNDKQRTWLLCSNDTIVWVVGYRADDRFKITDASNIILKFELKPIQSS